MSASQQKRTRANKRDEGADKRQTAQRKAEIAAKKEKRRVVTVCIVLAVVILLLVALNSSLLYNNFTAVQIGDVSYTASEFSFFYNSSYYNYVSYYGDWIQYMGLNTSKSLRSQAYDETQSWADYFKASAMTTMESVTMLWTEAQVAGFTMSQEQQAELDEIIASFANAHVGTDYPSADKYIATNYGKGLTLEGVSKLLEMSHIADAYAEAKYDSFTYTDEEIEGNYVEKENDFDTFSFLSYFASGAADEEAGIDSETAMSNAKKLADSILKYEAEDEEDAAEEDAFKQNVLDLTESDATVTTVQGSSLSSSFSEEVISWLQYPSREYGDKTVIETTDGYYSLFFVSRDGNDYNTVDVRHILFRVEADEEDVYTDEAKAAALKEAEDILAEWKAGDRTEESFAELANVNSDDVDSSGVINTDGGLYEDISKGRMVAEFNDWIFAPARKTGDTGIVFNEGSYCGYHIIYFVGYGDNYRSALSESDMRSADYKAWNEAQLESYNAETGFTAFLVK